MKKQKGVPFYETPCIYIALTIKLRFVGRHMPTPIQLLLAYHHGFTSLSLWLTNSNHEWSCSEHYHTLKHLPD